MLVVKEENKDSVELACKALSEGKIISFATDTVYGIAVDASNFKAVEDLYKLKNRDRKKPIAIFVKDLTAAKKIFLFDELSEKIANKFLPGSLTLILETKVESASLLASNLNNNDDGFLGFRIIENNFIKNLLEKFNGIIAVTSANLSNEQPALSASEVEKYFKNSTLNLLIDGGICKEKIASTVAKISNKKISILRQGPINLPTYENF